VNRRCESWKGVKGGEGGERKKFSANNRREEGLAEWERQPRKETPLHCLDHGASELKKGGGKKKSIETLRKRGGSKEQGDSNIEGSGKGRPPGGNRKGKPG